MKERVDVIVRAGQLVTCSPGGAPRKGAAMRDVAVLAPGALAVRDGIIRAVGTPQQIESSFEVSSEGFIEGALVIPGLVDAHTHPVFAGTRIDEYFLRAQGATYLEIHRQGGGILSTVRATRAASDEALLELLLPRLDMMLMHGTTTAEAKSGYGLSASEELRELRILKEGARRHPLELVSTFLGAHTVPSEFSEDRGGYLDEICSVMLPAVKQQELAAFVDVFCEEGAFSLEETEKIFCAARDLGLGLKIHAEQFSSRGSALMAARMGAVSCDHLLRLSSQDIEALRGLFTVLVFMPGTELFLNIHEYGPAREAIDSGLAVALGTDFNAGSCLSESMPMAMALAVLQMRLAPGEALIASTVNSAHSLGKGHLVGSLEPGKQADMVFIDCGDYREWLYHFGVTMVSHVMKKGSMVFTRGAVARPGV
ncbi:MAG: imidazolonepropionase [Candidatus Eremiobacteraeota bacterium]|nr:imidazolonepropionase [Candidatus Eremiobacteraeota bacterium]